MIELISKLPDTAIAVLLTGTAWFGFTYTVLADRAIDKELTAPLHAACVAGAAVKAMEIPLRSGIGELLGMPELDALEARIMERALPKALSEAEVLARCSCAVAGSQKLRFDYAVHLAAFRMVPVDRSAEFRLAAVDAASSGRCTEGAGE